MHLLCAWIGPDLHTIHFPASVKALRAAIKHLWHIFRTYDLNFVPQVTHMASPSITFLRRLTTIDSAGLGKTASHLPQNLPNSERWLLQYASDILAAFTWHHCSDVSKIGEFLPALPPPRFNGPLFNALVSSIIYRPIVCVIVLGLAEAKSLVPLPTPDHPMASDITPSSWVPSGAEYLVMPDGSLVISNESNSRRSQSTSRSRR